MPRSVKITLAEKEYTVSELKGRDNAKWRTSFEHFFSDLASLMEKAPEIELTNMASLAGLIRSGSSLLLHSIDKVKELLLEYAPNISDVIDEAYDSEVMAAFLEVLKLAYPFGTLLDKVRRLPG